MRANAGLFLLLGLLLIVGTVSANVADSNSFMDSDNAWPVANGEDTALITLTALNGTVPVPSATVSFSLAGYEDYGTLSQVTATTDSTGKATTTFTTKTKSGTAVITATITSSDAEGTLTVSETLDQEIDHNIAVDAEFTHPSELPVGNITTILVTVTDRYGNPVDNRNPAETHPFNLYMTDADGRGFWDGSWYTLNTTTPSLETDASGTASVSLRLANQTCRNMIFMQKIGGMSHTLESWIDGVAVDDVAYMVQDFSPSDGVIADGEEYFQLSYYVYDALMNPINGTLVHIVTSDGESMDKYSVDGLVYFEYGKKTEAHIDTITVTSANASMLCQPSGTTGYCAQDLNFINGDPVDIILTGIPSNLISLDQASGTTEGLVRAIVVDPKGNPVDGEDVTFTLEIETSPPYRLADGGPYDETTPPTLSVSRTVAGQYTNTTDGGVALAFFKSGAFATSGATYSGSAIGNATVTATWNGKTTSTKFTWRNYPTLSVKLPDDLCKDAHVGDVINLGMEVVGDGAALAPNPVHAMMVMDKSTSMNGGMSGASRIYWASVAGATFVGQMDSDRDLVGLTSYCSATTVDYPLSDQFSNVIGTINDLPSHTCGYTGTRNAIRTGIDQFPAYDPSDKSVRAIILLTDGEYNYYADPLARGYATSTYNFGATTYADRHTFLTGLPSPSGSSSATGGANIFTNQNMSEYAISQNIRIYTISVSPDMVEGGNTWNVLDNLALSTGGKHFHANTGSALQDYYTQIAGELIEKAAGDAEITMSFAGAEDGSTGLPLDIKEYMNYVPEAGTSSYVIMQNNTQIIYQYTQDDTTNWSRDPPSLAPSLYFKAGEMNLNDRWSVNYKVELLKAGNIRLFGPEDDNSEVCFVDVKTNERTCTRIEELNCPIKEDIGGTFNEEKVFIDITSATALGSDPKALTVSWDVTYEGDGEVVQTLSYLRTDIPNQKWISVYSLSDGPLPTTPEHHSYTIDTSTWPPGSYTLRVIGTSGKASHSDKENWNKQDTSGQVFLKLE